MVETLYQTATPETGKSECYGWWDENEKKFIHHVETLNTASEGVTHEEAQAIYLQARSNRVRDGFVYSFAEDLYGNGPHKFDSVSAAKMV